MLFCVITDVEFRGWEWSGKRCYDHLSGLLLCSLRLITTGWSLLHIFPSWLRPIINNADCVIFWVDRLSDICSSWEQRQTPLETSLVTTAADGSVEVTLSPWKRPPCVCWDILYQGRRSDLKPHRIYEPVVHNHSFKVHRREMNLLQCRRVTGITKFSCNIDKWEGKQGNQ